MWFASHLNIEIIILKKDKKKETEWRGARELGNVYKDLQYGEGQQRTAWKGGDVGQHSHGFRSSEEFLPVKLTLFILITIQL